MKFRSIAVCPFFVLAMCPMVAAADETMPQEGLWAKVGLGAASTAYAAASTSRSGVSAIATASGAAPELRLALGVVAAEGTVLHLSAGLSRLSQPEIKATAGRLEVRGTTTSTVSMQSASAGFTHYFGAASITARGGYAATSNDTTTAETSGWIMGGGLDIDFSSSDSSRFGLGVNADFAEVADKSGNGVAFASFGLFLSGAFY